MVVDDACLDGAFKLTDAAQRKTALSICTTMALKPRLNAEYDMTKLAANVGALVNTTNDDIEEA
jgi:predicted secreted Zn-dependent protease